MHSNEKNTVLAAADLEWVGKTLKEGKIVFVVSEKFYLDQKITEEELEKELKDAHNINLVGERSCRVAQNNGFLGEKVFRIAGVPHAQIYKV